MENLILGNDLQARQFENPAADGGQGAADLPTIVAPGATGSVGAVVFGPTAAPVEPTSIAPSTVTETPTVAATAAASSPAAADDSGKMSTKLIEILVPVCVVLALIPTAAYLWYLRRRDRRQREENVMRGRSLHSSSGATGEMLLPRRSTSIASQHERKLASISSAELELGVSGIAMEKTMSNSSRHQNSSIFTPAAHGPGGRRSPSGSVRTQPRPGFKPAPVASQSPTLPPLDFGKDDTVFSPLNNNSTAPTHSNSPSIHKPSVPATLPSFAPTQPKARAPNPALIPGRTASQSTTQTDNPSWPLPADGVRDSASTYGSTADRSLSTQGKSLPISGKEASLAPAPAAVARVQQQHQHGPRESSIAYGVPPMPPSPVNETEGTPDRRSGVSRKRDSDAISELSYSASTRGRRDTRRDTDAISIISALSHDGR